jgi:hypothetical protein
VSIVRPSGGKVDAFVSVVAVLDQHVRSATEFISDLHAVLSANYTNYELVTVINGVSPDQIPGIRDLLGVLPCVRVLRLSRTFSVDTAIFAGLESAIGDYVVNLTPELDPVELVPDLVALAMQGNDVIQGISLTPGTGSSIRKFGRRAFFGYNRRYLHVNIPPQATYLTCLSRRALNSLANASRSLRYLSHLIRHIGYRLTDYEYVPLDSSHRVYSLRNDILKGLEMITSYSAHPLRFVTLIGVLSGIANLLYAFYVVVLRIVSTDVVAGWTTISLQLSATFFIFSIILAVQAEYIGRILAETRREPVYFIMEEMESDTLIADLNRRNLSS